MYLRAVHADADVATLRQLIRENPLGILTTAIPSQEYPLLQSTHIPFVLDDGCDGSDDEEAKPSVLRAHLARQNPHSKALVGAAQALPPSAENVLEQEVMVLFTSPVQHYVTPKFYTETKPESGKVVPTWNYAAAQVYGRAKIYHDSKAPETTAYLSRQVNDLTQYAESSIMGYTGSDGNKTAWKVADAPDGYINILQKNIVGVEITIERLHGKFKMSQEMPRGDRDGVEKGFQDLGTDVGVRMASTVAERGQLKDATKQNAQ